MRLTKSKLKHIIHEELSNVSKEVKNLEEQDYTGEGDHRTEWLVERVGELFRRITELEKQIGLEWKEGD